ncbi:cytosolic carboxypeptidase 6-like [Alligator mississippiensis]|uniref:Cytosolic carboxypeptidase 6-like n=1 Tax=Alligator mississippiensis TaxID=8496 RepID=A0A151M488_ALLMI|nr:cytosolic carboxypeptidase 6-like [Alligator mississippiensis]
MGQQVDAKREHGKKAMPGPGCISILLAAGCRQRLPPKNVYYYRCPDHRKNYVMSFAFCFDREDDIYQFAYCYPYTYTRLQHYLDNLQRRNMDYFCRELLGLSVQQRRLDLLTITNPVPPTSKGKK